MPAPSVIAPVRRELDQISAKVTEWLRKRLGTPDLVISDLSYPLGAGLSNETILLEAAWTAQGRSRQEGFVIRLEPNDYRVYMDLDFEGQFQLQANLHQDAAVPVPTMLFFENNTSVLGARFFVMGRLRGKVAVSYPPYATHGWVAESTIDQQRKIWRNGVAALASIASAPIASVSMLDRPQYGDNGWEQEWTYWMKSYEWSRKGRSIMICELTLEWLKANMPAERLPGLTWGDARLGNLMYNDEHSVIAVLDWEGASLGGGLQDLGYWLFLDEISTFLTGATVEGFGTREETIALWEEVSGLTANNVEWYEIFGGFKLACHAARKSTLDGCRPGFNYGDNPATRFLAKRLELPAPGMQN